MFFKSDTRKQAAKSIIEIELTNHGCYITDHDRVLFFAEIFCGRDVGVGEVNIVQFGYNRWVVSFMFDLFYHPFVKTLCSGIIVI